MDLPMKKYLVALAIFSIIILSACNKKSDSDTLIVSVEPQRALLEQIAGDKFQVVTMLTPGANPETFEPGMQARRKLETAAAYFITGYLPFEHKLEEAARSTTVVNTSAGIQPVFGTHNHHHDEGDEHHNHDADHHDHGNADPHVWTSVKNVKTMAHNMYQSLVALRPESREYFTRRYHILNNRLDSLDRAFTARLAASSAPKAFAIWHPSLSYLARDYGLKQIPVGFENKEMPAGTLKRVVEAAKKDGVRVFFFQKEFDSRQADALSKEMGTNLVTIYPLDYEWENQLDSIVSALCR